MRSRPPFIIQHSSFIIPKREGGKGGGIYLMDDGLIPPFRDEFTGH